MMRAEEKVTVSPVRLEAAGLHYRELNARIREAVKEGARALEVAGVNGQRYIADGLSGDVRLDIYGVPGNDLGAFMDGPTVVVHNNAQDAVGNTMNRGKIVIHGDGGDVLGYGLRGGALYVRGRVGYRVGIHMKAFKRQAPVLIVGGAAGDFFGEYMAGGVLIALGLDRWPGEPIIGQYCATGLHGGTIYLRGQPPAGAVAEKQVSLEPATDDDRALLQGHLQDFCTEFGLALAAVLEEPFWRLRPASHRPYGSKYAP